MHQFAKFFCFFLFFLAFLGFVKPALALTSVSDTITTSRPSPSTPLSANVVAGNGSVGVFNNGSTFLASDSAKLFGPVDTLETLTVSTVSAAKTTLFFTSNLANNHTNGTVVTAPITAMHKIQFTTQSSITGGSIQIVFPNAGSTDTNAASPSASTFMFNALTTTLVKSNNLTCTGSWTISQSAGNPSTIGCDISGTIGAGTTVTILVGCSVQSSGNCTTQVPTLINPTKTAGSGVSDVWSVKVDVWSGTGASGTIVDGTTTKIGTIESVNVIAHIDPTFSFTITGMPNGTALNTVGTCGTSHATDTSNSGFDATSSDINLGTLLATQVNRAIQKFVLTSNAISGYSVTATSSGHLINPSNGYYLQDAQGTPTGNDTPTPNGATASISNGDGRFGIHPCDANSKVNTTTWGQATPFFANPSASFYYTLVNSNSAPAATGDTIYVEYAASPLGNTPPGDYHTTLTYVATTVF